MIRDATIRAVVGEGTVGDRREPDVAESSPPAGQPPEVGPDAPPLTPPAGQPRQDLTRGSIARHIITLALPSAAASLLQFSYHFVDMMWLGRIGPSAIAVVAAYHFFFMVFVFFNQIVGLGSITLIARTYGAGDLEGCRRYIGQTFSFKLVISLVVMALGLVLQRWMWTAFGSEPDVIAQGLPYTTIMFSVIPIYFSAFTLRTAFSSIGDMQTLLRISAVSTGLNLVLDPFFIFERVFIGPFPALGLPDPLLTLPGLGMGVAGAAWASFGAILVLFLLGQYYFMTGRTFLKVTPRHFFSWDWRTVWQVLRIGTPPAVGENLTSIAQIAVGRVMNTYGTAVFAASGVMGMAFGLVFVPVGGIWQAVMTLVGQNLGAGKPQRAERSVWTAAGMTLGLLVVVLGAAALWTPGLVRLFVPGTDEVSLNTLLWGVRFLRVALLMMLFMGLGFVFGAAFWGSGDTKPPMWATVVTTYGVQLPIVLLGALWLKLEDPTFIVWAWVVSQLLNTVILYVLFKRGRWKTVKV